MKPSDTASEPQRARRSAQVMVPPKLVASVMSFDLAKKVSAAALSFSSRTASTGSCVTSCVFGQDRGSLNVVEKTTFDMPARAPVPGSPPAANPDMTR